MKKVIIQEHGNEWPDRVMICPECSGDKLFSMPIHWRTATREGEGMRYQCETCDCRFDVHEKGHLQRETKIIISTALIFVSGAISLLTWAAYYASDMEVSFLSACGITSFFVISLIIAMCL